MSCASIGVAKSLTSTSLNASVVSSDLANKHSQQMSHNSGGATPGGQEQIDVYFR